MMRIVLLGSDNAVEPPVKKLASLLDAQLSIVDTSEIIRNSPPDVVFWYTYPFDFAIYRSLEVLCPRIVWLLNRSFLEPEPRFGVHRGPRIPCPTIIVPFDPEEFDLTIRAWLTRWPKLA